MTTMTRIIKPQTAMRTRLYLWPLLALLALSCSKGVVPETPENQEVKQPEALDPWTFYPSEALLAPKDTPHTIIASNIETKSHLEQTGADQYSIVWTAGDSFIVFGVDADNNKLYAPYTTASGGENAAFSTEYGLGESINYYAVYPASVDNTNPQYVSLGTFTVNGQIKPAIGVTIPATQAATAGSVAEGANIAFAKPNTLNEKFRFLNMVSMIKFRLSGSVTGEVKSVTFRGTSSLAGGYVFYIQDDNPVFLPNINWSGHDKAGSITLSGDFVEGQEYYIALAPCTQNGFSMVFANSGGTETTTLVSSSTMTFNRSVITDFGTIDLGGSFSDTPYTEPEYIKYLSASVAGAKPVSLVVLPDGYTASELSDYEVKAKAGMDALFNVEPFKSYKAYFNVWIMKVASNESGANVTDGNGTIITPKDCYFGSKWGADSYNDLDANSTTIYSFVSQYCPDLKDASHDITEVPVLLIVNDDRYGGRAMSNSLGRSYCIVPTTAGSLSWVYPTRKARTDEVIDNPTLENDLIDTPEEERAEVGSNTGNWMNTLVHEFGGHSFGRLGDEYWYDTSMKSGDIQGQSWTVPFNLNLAATPTGVPWQSLMTATSGNNQYRRMGIFQGGDVSPFNRWRSEKVSCMIDNRFYFSAYQRYLIVQRIRSLAGLEPVTIDEFLAHDVATDPLRDEISSSVIGVSNAVPPRPVPMLPPPLLVE